MSVLKRLLIHKLSKLMLLFAVAFFYFTPASASSDLSNLSITNQYESSTKYFYNLRPNIAGSISTAVTGVVVVFDNVADNDDYSVTITQTYPASSFTTANDCFSSKLNSSQCVANIPDGTYEVSIEASRDIYSEPSNYLFSKLFVKTSVAAAVDNIAPVKPIIDAIASPLNADNINLTGKAEANALVTITGGGQSKTQQLVGGNNSFSISVTLAQNSQNNFSITATDDAGNISLPAFVSITEVSSASTVGAVSGLTAQKSVSMNDSTSNTVVVANNTPTEPEALSVGKIAEVAGIVKGTSAPVLSDETSKSALTTLYSSVILLLIIWGLYFQKKFFMHRQAIDIDKKVKKNKIK